ncbi:hypothetical protein Phep_0888 [Pedobacter heparinus DSM 2366]|uniref:Cardiolipin synthase N-terminal domain-containing protein n=1 Tax=Pedobacter heparinus (strain ATCC 13125 / DSM 2366 / CIP 104194 / JCM 7457 / NBRC 12017 / NCIMB 9290 / NRRL B-14731 / HIM 762-3) TaxID=485917 RepID=C6Y2B7_PEDHD|nr:hypothetical protein Phep_0888 [Pedobacter heparinus DSM 2366]
MLNIIISLLLISYMIYGIANIVKNKSLNRGQKAIWIVIAVCIPVLGRLVDLTKYPDPGLHKSWVPKA